MEVLTAGQARLAHNYLCIDNYWEVSLSVHSYMRGHRAAVPVARRREAAVEGDVVRVALGNMVTVRRRHRALCHVGQDGLELRLEG